MKLIKQFQSGHKYFEDAAGILHIADDSGETPHSTEDGDLTIDKSRLISAPRDSDGFAIPLLTPSGKPVTTPATYEEAAWLVEKGMAVDGSASCRIKILQYKY